MILKVGQRYKTRGGWPAVVIWAKAEVIGLGVSCGGTKFYVIHKPGTCDESPAMIHDFTGKGVGSAELFMIGYPVPTYGLNYDHPADLIEEL